MRINKPKGEARLEYLRKKYPDLTLQEFTIKNWKFLWYNNRSERWTIITDEYWNKVSKDPDRILEALAEKVQEWLEERGLGKVKFRTKHQIHKVALILLHKKDYLEAIKPKNWKERFPKIFRKTRSTPFLNNLSLEHFWEEKKSTTGTELVEIRYQDQRDLEIDYACNMTISRLNNTNYKNPEGRRKAVEYLEQLFLVFPCLVFDWTDIYELPRFIRDIFIKYGRVYLRASSYTFIRQKWDKKFKYYLPKWQIERIFKNQIGIARNLQARDMIIFVDNLDPKYSQFYQKESRRDRFQMFLKQAGITSPLGRNRKVQRLFPGYESYIVNRQISSAKRAAMQVKYNGTCPGKNWKDSGILSDLRKMNSQLVKARELENFGEFDVLENIFERSTKKRKIECYDMLMYTVKEAFNFFYLYPRTEADFKLLKDYGIPVLGQFTKYLPPTPENIELVDEVTRELLGIQKIISIRLKEKLASPISYKGMETDNIIVPFVGDTYNPVGVNSFLFQVFTPPSPLNIISLIYSGKGLITISSSVGKGKRCSYFEVTEDWKVTKIGRHLQGPGPEVKWIVGFTPRLSAFYDDLRFYFREIEVFGEYNISPWRICEESYQSQLLSSWGPFVVYSIEDNKLYFPKYGSLEPQHAGAGKTIFSVNSLSSTFPDIGKRNQRRFSQHICYYVEKLKNEQRTFDTWLYEMSRTYKSKTRMASKS